MKFKIKIKRDEVWDELYLRLYLLIKENKQTWASAIAILGLSGGLLAPFAGALLNVIDWLAITGIAHFRLYGASIICYGMTLPLLALGAHCLDLLEKKSSNSVTEKLLAEKLNLGLKA